MKPTTGSIPQGMPDPIDIAHRVGRGRKLFIPLDMDMQSATAIARTLRDALPPHVTVFAVSGTSRGSGLTVLQLVTDAEAAAVRPALDHLVAEFRQSADALVAHMLAAMVPAGDLDGEFPDTVRIRDATWDLEPHGAHCRFEGPNGEVVEADIYSPDTIDPYFLLLYAETTGGHGAVLDACVEGFHDMCRLLELTGHPPRSQH
ncbi:hypothetical protein Lfu02_03910 [Longispora fulva]|uniref:DUF6896 domain-containing protein n=1 Tax=Longispora fulva TaxID=619741 RepID=A0A8J7KJR2_9ACTN|nr:hypothetical protein [Longispora fulva]MBG6135741.1 hypothetical protein [Longispora fulva]GIG56019.1 hypothetical protein Lfu02_03910 [Longispora fulva]